MDLQTTNIWLGIIAIASLVQLTALTVVGVAIMRRLARAQEVIDGLSHDAKPLIHRASLALDDIKDLTERARHAEESVRGAVDRMGARVDKVKAVALTRIWPAVAIAKMLRSTAATLRERRRARASSQPAEAIAEARFIGEGGAHAGRVGR